MTTCIWCGGNIKEYSDGSAICDTCFLTFCCDGVIDISDIDLTMEEKEQLKEVIRKEGFYNINE